MSFEWFKKNKKNKEDTMTQDEKDIAKAKRDIDEKGSDSQTEKDRIDESVGEQERRDGDENSQSAKDRVDESEGAKKADEKREEERREEKPEWAKELSEGLTRVIELLEKSAKSDAVAEDADEEAAKNMEEAFGGKSGTFATEPSTEKEGKKLTGADVAKIINKIM